MLFFATFRETVPLFSFDWVLLLVDMLVSVLTAVHLGVNKLALSFKTIYLVPFSWYLHAAEVTRAATRQMNEALQDFQKRVRKASIVSGVYDSREGLLCSRIATIWTTVFMREHSTLLVDLVHFNQRLVSPLLFWVYTPILAASVYVLCLLYFFPMHWFVWLLLLGQLIGLFNTFALLALLPAVVGALYDHSVMGQLYRAQMLLYSQGIAGNGAKFRDDGGRLAFALRTKIKLMTYYEVLKTDNKCTFTFGSHSKIENTWLWEVSFVE